MTDEEMQRPLLNIWRNVRKCYPENVVVFFEFGWFLITFESDADRCAKIFDTALVDYKGVNQTGFQKSEWQCRSETLHFAGLSAYKFRLNANYKTNIKE